jgi:hypothetical protein
VDTVKFTTRLLNPNDFSFDAQLIIENFNREPIANISLFDDGMHGDSLANDNVWGAAVLPLDKEEYYRSAVLINNTTLDNNFYFQDLERFTTIGPVRVAENAYMDTIYNSTANRQYIILFVTNNSLTATVEKPLVSLSTSDPRVDTINIGTRGFPDLGPGETNEGLYFRNFSFTYADGFLPNSTLESPIRFTVTVSIDGHPYWISGFDFIANKLTGIENSIDPLPTVYVLKQNYPNPFNPNTTIQFQIPNSQFVTLKVYDILGKEVLNLVSKKLNQGNHSYTFDGSDLASGIYYYQLVGGDYREVKKMILLR